MVAALTHRGPDDEGIYLDAATPVALGARRLSILDLAGGHQPRSNETGSIWVVLNGEIYNHASLRERLVEQGHALRGHSDTEVVSHLYEEYGDDFVHALEGMFALAIWDTQRSRLVLARDRFGEKPLFYGQQGGNVSFASELTALRRGFTGTPALNPSAIDSYFVLGYVPGPETFIEGVRQVRPGHIVTWDRETGALSETQYWAPPMHGASSDGESVEELAAEAGRILDLSIRDRLVADVPLGVFLSGGVDSTVIATMAARRATKPIKTFTVGYDVGDRDERREAGEVARLVGADHQELVLTTAQAAMRVPELLARLDQPLADQAIVPLHSVAEFARDEVTVAIGGEGADELFGGYPRYGWLRRAPTDLPAILRRASPMLGRLPVALPTSGRARRGLDLAMPRPILERHLDWVSAGRRHVRDWIYGDALKAALWGGARDATASLAAPLGETNLSTVGSMMRLDQQRWLPDDVLAKADRAGMLVSLEIRTPYLHRELAEFAASVAPETHVARGGKRLLRRLLSDILPEAPKRRKEAFLPPTADWLRGPLAQVVEAQLRSGSIYEERLFSRTAARALFDQHRAGRADWSEVLWSLLALGIWLDTYRGIEGA
jgi:asparagine synthase (glutamine-hydrolysing)